MYVEPKWNWLTVMESRNSPSSKGLSNTAIQQQPCPQDVTGDSHLRGNGSNAVLRAPGKAQTTPGYQINLLCILGCNNMVLSHCKVGKTNEPSFRWPPSFLYQICIQGLISTSCFAVDISTLLASNISQSISSRWWTKVLRDEMCSDLGRSRSLESCHVIDCAQKSDRQYTSIQGTPLTAMS